MTRRIHVKFILVAAGRVQDQIDLFVGSDNENRPYSNGGIIVGKDHTSSYSFTIRY